MEALYCCKRRHFACALCAMEPCLSERRNAGARKMTLLPMFRSLSVNQGCVHRDRFLNSRADWGCLEHLLVEFLQSLLGRVSLQVDLDGDVGIGGVSFM